MRVTYQLMTTPIDGSEDPMFDPRDDMLSTYSEFFSALCGPDTSMIRTPAVDWILDQVSWLSQTWRTGKAWPSSAFELFACI